MQSLDVVKTDIDLNYCSTKRPVTPVTSPEAKPNPKLTIDGIVVEFAPGDTIIQVAERAGISERIPRYCYHPGLPIAGSCRMCTVEVEKMPKLTTSCSTPAADGMIVHTKSPRVLKSRAGVMEFLLTNHPLDCPVCDKAGECELQDYNFEYGPGTSRFLEEKRVYEKATTKDLSKHIKLNMNRCVACERCVRFCEDVTKTHDLVMLNRGWKKELSVTEESVGLTSDYQGCLADICPVGALTNNDFRFEKRVWFLKKNPSVCDQCSKGCNIEVHHEQDVVYRYRPIFNEKINGHWMCDEGRLSYHQVMNLSRIISPMVKFKGELHSTSWELAGAVVKGLLGKANKVQVILGTDVTNEEVLFLTEKLPKLFGPIFSFNSFNGTPGVASSADDKKLDHLLRMKDKTPNTRGLEKLGIKPHQGDTVQGQDIVILVRFGRAGIVKVNAGQKIVAWGAWTSEEVKSLGVEVEAVIPGLMTPEKGGTFINADGYEQYFTPSVVHKGYGVNVDKALDYFVQK